jgi:hypothetical protein
MAEMVARMDDATSILASFEHADFQEYPVVSVGFSGLAKITTPCCGNYAWHSEETLHKCAFCRKYYFVLEEFDD